MRNFIRVKPIETTAEALQAASWLEPMELMGLWINPEPFGLCCKPLTYDKKTFITFASIVNGRLYPSDVEVWVSALDEPNDGYIEQDRFDDLF